MVKSKVRIEQKILKQSALLMLVMAISATITGVLSNSYSLVVEGVFSSIAFVIKILMYATAKMIESETSKKFQFGYWQFEPLVFFIEGSFILIIIIYAFLSGINNLLQGGNLMKFDFAIYYALAFTIINICFYMYVYKINLKVKSNMLKFDNISWLVDVFLTGSLLVSFVFAWSLQFTEWRFIEKYVDPVILIILSVQMIPSTLKILVPSIKQIIGLTPIPLHNNVVNILNEMQEKYKFKDFVTSVKVSGRMKLIEIDILMDKNYEYPNLGYFDEIRSDIDRLIGGSPKEKWVTIAFTTERKWMAKKYEEDDEDENE